MEYFKYVILTGQIPLICPTPQVLLLCLGAACSC